MSDIAAVHNTGLAAEAGEALRRIGVGVFAFAMVALGVETLISARNAAQVLGPQYNVIPVIPWLPAISWLAYLFGAVWVACGVGLLSRRTVRAAALTLSARSFSTFRKTPRILAAYRCARRCLSPSRSQVLLGSFPGASQRRISSRAQAATCSRFL